MKCKICDHETTPFFDKQLNKTYSQCPFCEAIFLNETFFVTREKEKSQYDNHNNSLDNKGYVQMFENFLDFFWEEFEKAPKNALDFGCGPGPVLQTLLEKRGLTCNVYDKFYQPEKVYENTSYDLITCTEVFEHLSNPKKTLLFFKEHLNPQGYVAIMTLFHTTKQEDFLRWWYRRDPTHITFFTPKTFEILANMYGFEVIKTDSKRVVVLKLM